MLWPYAFCTSALVMLAACASVSNHNERAALECHAAELEPDLQSEFIVGSADAPKIAAGAQYIVSSTYGIPKRGADGEYLSPRYGMLMGMIVEKLQSQPGLISLQVSSSERCGSGRTLAVWESEELMYDFVTTGPHLAAMSSAEELLQPGYAVAHWSASSREQMMLTAAPDHLQAYFE